MKKKSYMRMMGPVLRRKADVQALAFDTLLHVMETWLSQNNYKPDAKAL